MADSCDTDTAVRTFDREIRLLQSTVETVRRVNGGIAAIGDTVASVAWADPVTAVPHAREVPEPATTISAALGGSDAMGAGPRPRFLGGSSPGLEGLLACGVADAGVTDLRSLLVLSDRPMSSFVPDHGLRIIDKDKEPAS